MDPSRPPQTFPSTRMAVAMLIAGVLLLLIMIPLTGGAYIRRNVFGIGERAGTSTIAGGNTISCANVANVPSAYMPWVKDASGKWLGGDEAALIALIQLESSWDPKNYPKQRIQEGKNKGQLISEAAGLGQFLTSTARGMNEFSGGSDSKGKNWPAGELIHPNPEGAPNDARFDPERSIYAAAHYMNQGKFLTRGLGEMYEVHYHGGSTPSQNAAARAGRERLEKIYNQIKADSCTEVASAASSDSGTTPVGRYAPPLPPALLKAKMPLQPHHDGSSAVDIGVPTGTAVYALTSGKISSTMHSRRQIAYGTQSSSGNCGTGLVLLGDDGVNYLYCHMDKLASGITTNIRVEAGDQLGVSDNTGRSSGPHLHIGAKQISASELRKRIESTVK